MLAYTKTVFRHGIAYLQSDNLLSILARGAGGAFLVDTLGRGLLFVLQILLAQVMGLEQYGIYVYVIAWLNVLVLAAQFGLDTTLLRYVAVYRARQEWSFLRGLLNSSLRLVLIIGIMACLALAAVVAALRANFEPELAYTFWIACLALPFLALLSLRQAALQALKHVVLARLPVQIVRQGVLALSVVSVAALVIRPMSASAVMWLHLLSVMLALGLATWWLRSRIPHPAQVSPPAYRRREWTAAALPLFMVSAIYMLSRRTDVLMVGLLLDTTQAGIYTAASRVADLALLGLIAAQAVAAPMIAELFTHHKLQELQRVVTLTARGAFGFALPLALILILGGRWILALFGSQFQAGYWPLVLLLAGQLINALTGPVGLMLSMTGHHNHLVIILAISLVFNIVFNYFFITTLGIAGAALATGLVNIGWNVAATWFVHRRLHINCFAFA